MLLPPPALLAPTVMRAEKLAPSSTSEAAGKVYAIVAALPRALSTMAPLRSHSTP
jgi:hypothetical protein